MRQSPFSGATPPCRPPGSWRFFDSYPALTRWANPPVALNGLVATEALRLSRLIPRAAWRQEKVKTPTLTSNSTTLGWGTLESFGRVALDKSEGVVKSTLQLYGA